MLKYSKIIAVSGLRNSGKDISSDMLWFCLNTPKILHTYYIYNHFKQIARFGRYIKTSFAKSLKEILGKLLNVSVEKFEDRDFKENWYVDFTKLKLINKNDIVDNNKILPDNRFSKCAKDLKIITKDYYLSIRQLLQYFGTEIMRYYFGDNIWILSTLRNEENKNIIITDLRFKAEAKYIKSISNTKIIYINRNGCIPGSHASEKEVIDMLNSNVYDYIIDNNGSLKDLFNKIKSII